jgi:hypothetical protein
MDFASNGCGFKCIFTLVIRTQTQSTQNSVWVQVLFFTRECTRNLKTNLKSKKILKPEGIWKKTKNPFIKPDGHPNSTQNPTDLVSGVKFHLQIQVQMLNSILTIFFQMIQTRPARFTTSSSLNRGTACKAKDVRWGHVSAGHGVSWWGAPRQARSPGKVLSVGLNGKVGLFGNGILCVCDSNSISKQIGSLRRVLWASLSLKQTKWRRQYRFSITARVRTTHMWRHGGL